MRRIILCILCCLLLTTAVSAAGTVTSMESNATMSSNGTCRMALTFQLTVDGTEKELRFPLPGSAKDISLNGGNAKTYRSSGLRWVDLSGVVYGAGSYSITLHYSLPDLVQKEGKSGLLLTLPLLSGFPYPIDRLEFSVKLPGNSKENPTFTSTYHPESMDTFVNYNVDGQMITGYFTQGIKDHETLTMHLPVSSSMFPQGIAKRWSLSYDDLVQYALLLLAVVYWILFLRCPLPRQLRRVQAPDGITAGELGCCLNGLGVDFSMMILSWAQMGYLTLELDRHGHILLHKRMDMGNERSNFEMRCFKTLFGRRVTVDGGSEHFARLSRKAGKTVLGASYYFKRESGNPLIMRCLAAGIGTVAGYSLAVAFAHDTVWQVVLGILLIPLGTVLSWLIQRGMRGFVLRHRRDLVLAVLSCVLWLVLGIFAGEAGVAVLVILTQILAGLGAIHGGRRTEGGLQSRNEILGLRRYLKTVTAQDLARITEDNPDYFFNLLPEAMALGVDRAFARQLGDEKIGNCPYLQTAEDTPRTAKQWDALLRQAVLKMEERKQKMKWQKFFGR